MIILFPGTRLTFRTGSQALVHYILMVMLFNFDDVAG